MAKILHTMLSLQNQLRLYHWQTSSFARHKASDMLVTELNIHIDNYIEVCQGLHGIIKMNKSTKTIHLNNINDKNITQFLIKHRDMLIKLSKPIKNTDLLNIRDEIVASINKTLYLFNLK